MPPASMKTAKYLFLKQAASIESYFGEMAIDVASAEGTVVVYSSIASQRIGETDFIQSPKYDATSKLSRIKSWVKYLWSSGIFAFRLRGDPLLFIVAQPPFLPLLGYLQKKLLRRKYVVWVDDIYPDILVRSRVFGEENPVILLWEWFNRLVLGESEHVFTLGPYMMRAVTRYLPASHPTTIVPTWVDPSFIEPVPKSENAFVSDHGLAGKFCVMYSGNMGETQDLASVLNAARALRDRDDIHFMIVGGGSQWERIHESVREQKDSNINVLPWQRAETLSHSLSSADISLILLGKGLEGISMPSKTYYAMAVGSALIGMCGADSDLAWLIKSYRCGIIVEPGDSSGLAKAICRLRDDRILLAEMKMNSRNAAVEHFSRATNTRIIRNILASIQE